MIVIILAIIEYKVNFVEKTVGHYLNDRNKNREAWGRSWDMQRSAQEAAKILDEKATSSSKLRSQAELVSNFSELFNVIPDGEGVPISPDKFVNLFLTLPVGLRNSVIETSSLVNLFNEGKWVRTSVWRRRGNITAFLVDARNRVLENISVSSALRKAAAMYGQKSDGRLSDFPLFNEKIIPAPEFFEALSNLLESDRKRIVSDQEFMLRLPRPIINTAIAEMQDTDGFSLIAFESRIGNSPVVTILPVPSNYLLPLTQLLTKETDSVVTDTLNTDSTSADTSLKRIPESVR
ncbi:hypothetical protein K9N50_06175 [bacterium]|nr:hypothetical protein [bacterium]